VPKVTYERERRYSHDGPRIVTLAGPPLLRTGYMNKWHRPRSAYSKPNGVGFAVFWCGARLTRNERVKSKGVYTADELPPGDTLCGPCELHALKNGHQPLSNQVTFPTRWRGKNARWVSPLLAQLGN
jgi:hypothetical protein